MNDAVVARARACVGARFRLQGRDPATGLDCVGVAAIALGVVPGAARYALRGGDPVALAARIDAVGVQRIAPEVVRAGDVAMVAAGPAQLHLVVLTETGFVHADAWIGRVVEVPGRANWPVLAAWRKD